MDPAIVAILLLALALFLFAIEVFIPSGGVLVIGASGTLIASFVFAWRAWWPGQVGYFWLFLGSAALLVPGVVMGMFTLWPYTPMGRRAILQEPRPEEIASFVELDERNSHLVGKIGKAATTMNPAGILLLDGQRIQCQSEGMIIEIDETVKVISAYGNRVIVRRVPQSGSNGSPGNSPPTTTAQTAPPLDFDLGQR
jgi:membrane-bound ClpP family serine protease